MLLQVTATADAFMPREMVTLFWELRRLGITPRGPLVDAMQRRAVATAKKFDHDQVTDLIGSLARMGVTPHAPLLAAMQQRLLACAEEDCDPLHDKFFLHGFEVTGLFCSLAKMGITPDAALLEAMQPRATATADDVASAGQIFNPTTHAPNSKLSTSSPKP